MNTCLQIEQNSLAVLRFAYDFLFNFPLHLRSEPLNLLADLAWKILEIETRAWIDFIYQTLFKLTSYCN